MSDEKISVNIIPKPLKSDQQDDGSALTTPLRVTGSPKELDEQLSTQLAEFVGTHLGLSSTLKSAKEQMEAAAKAAREAARKPTNSKSHSGSSKSAPPSPAKVQTEASGKEDSDDSQSSPVPTQVIVGAEGGSIAIDLQSRLQRVGASIRRILEITSGDPQIAGCESIKPLGCDIKPELEFRSVWFCYNEDRPVLRNMSFLIEAGETVAVVGLNGSGKSTIGLLATRLYEPNAGSILVGGQDIRQVGRRSLRATLTLVPQDPVLFDETIRENLLYGNPRATGKDLETVAALTQLDRVLQTLPRGLDEPLGPLGGHLSGGEKKRLALARTLLQQPRILIVDEITSALDGPAAAGLLEGLELFRQARTLVVISHRPATILWADRILVVDAGAIVDSGKHDALILRCEAYQRIWQSQDRMASINSPGMEWTGNGGVVPELSRNA